VAVFGDGAPLRCAVFFVVFLQIFFAGFLDFDAGVRVSAEADDLSVFNFLSNFFRDFGGCAVKKLKSVEV
jgi:hypothetical protein